MTFWSIFLQQFAKAKIWQIFLEGGVVSQKASTLHRPSMAAPQNPEVNSHHCTKKSKSFEGKCRYSFPRYPLKETLVIDKNESKNSSDLRSTEQQSNDRYKNILNDVEETLSDPEIIDFIMVVKIFKVIFFTFIWRNHLLSFYLSLFLFI